MFPSPHICLQLSVCTGDCWQDGPHVSAKTNMCVSSCLLAVCFSVGLEITLWTHTPIMMMSLLHLRLHLMMQRHFCLCLYYPQCTWKMTPKASGGSAGCFWLIDWLIRSSLSTVVCSAGQATCSGVDGDSGIGAEGQHVEGAGSGRGQLRLKLLISQQTRVSYIPHVLTVLNQSCFWGSITRAHRSHWSSAVTGSNSGFISRMLTSITGHESCDRLLVEWCAVTQVYNATRNNGGQRASLCCASWVIPSGSFCRVHKFICCAALCELTASSSAPQWCHPVSTV